jgi:hypothetical protein
LAITERILIMTTTATKPTSAKINLATIVFESEAAAAEAAKAQAKAIAAAQRAEAAKAEADREREAANVRFLAVLEQEHGAARTEALDRQSEDLRTGGPGRDHHAEQCAIDHQQEGWVNEPGRRIQTTRGSGSSPAPGSRGSIRCLRRAS